MGYLTALYDRVGAALASQFAYSWSPPGLRLEMHPRVQYDIYRDPDTPWLLQNLSPGFTTGDLESLLGVPVKVAPELPDGTWRLVAVSETVLASGGGEPLAIVPRTD